MNLPQVYMCSPSWTLLPLPSPYHPPGSSQCTSPKHPVSCIEAGLATRFIYDIMHVSYMILCMFQCHSPKSSHPLPLPQNPKDCSIHQCFFCPSLSYRFFFYLSLLYSLLLLLFSLGWLKPTYFPFLLCRTKTCSPCFTLVYLW